jgi:hypothetical protein
MPLKTTLIASSVLLAACAIAQDTAQNVTFSTKAAPAKAVLEQLSKLTGVTLLTSPQVANEPLIVRVKDQPLSVLMAKIAEAASAEWQKESNGYRLIRTQARANREMREELAASAAQIKAELDKLAKQLSDYGTFDAKKAKDEAEAAAKLRKQIEEQIGSGGPVRTQFNQGRPTENPASLALKRLLTTLDPAVIAALAPESRTVFALTPTFVQRALPPKAGAILKRSAIAPRRRARTFESST